ncbi:ThuA domain-containing protein [Flammeovirgaceae bacterium SG7u.111]|nr:ThuA domain-containing protein [Flammeovirgaceae bacterium SG7u.132]WPO35330.1 ThuA domain-containing protein [Flammeovirgaceae bacterium SG7u.111]
MNKQFWKQAFICLALTSIISGLFSCSHETREKKVLVFSKTGGFRHGSIAAGKVAMLKLGKEMGFAVDTTENASVFTEDSLKNYSAVVFLNTTGNVLDHIQQADFRRYIQAGGGFVGIHAAADTEYKWPWYGKLVGGWFNGHPSDPNVREGKVTVINHDHISVENLDSSFVKTDEFYNYKSFNEHVNVLITVDEKSYGAGKHGDFHPITWYHDFDGGRAFYTGFGHTDETFEEKEFLEIIKGGITYAIGDNHLDYAHVRQPRVPEENRFVKAVYASNLNEPMELEVLDSGKILFIERGGTVNLYLPKEEKVKEIAKIPVHTKFEDGLLGLALDPDFENNYRLYLFYSPKGDKPIQRVSRFSYIGDSLLLDTEKTIIEMDVQRDECCHSAGSMQFGPDGNLYIALGDDSSPFNTNQEFDTDGFGPMDEREGRSPFDAQKSSSNTNDLRGKILRIKPEIGGTYSIPDGNLFPKDGSQGRPEIFVMGCRNPYRMSVDSKKGWLFWGDVGPDAGNDNPNRGPRGYDEFNLAKTAGYYGWPYFVGNNYAYRKMNYETGEVSDFFDPENPINTSPNNTGMRKLPPARPALIWYPYAESPDFEDMTKGGRNAMAGPTYYYDQFPYSKNKLPKYYHNKVFHYDWSRNWIHAVTLDAEGNFIEHEPFLPNMKFEKIIDMELGPDGALYVLEYGANWFSRNPDAVLARIDYAEGNRKPIARISAEGLVGAAPLSVQFTGEGSTDFDEEDELTYEWIFEGNEVQSTEMAPSYKFTKPGVYKVRMRASDPSGGSSVANIEVQVGNDIPNVDLQLMANETFYWPGEKKQYTIKVTDTEDGTPDDSQVQVFFDFISIGEDLAAVGPGHKQSSAVLNGETLINENGCKTCHAIDAASVGPSYTEVAQRYETNQETISTLAAKVISGGNGNWGERMMSAHPQLSVEQAEAMIGFVLSLDEESTKPSLPLAGVLDFDQGNGKYILKSSYTDKGGEVIGSLNNTKTIEFRPAKVEAEDYDSFFKIAKRRPAGTNVTYLHRIQPDSHFMFKGIDLSGVDKITMRTSATGSEGFKINLRLGSPKGEIVASGEVPFTTGKRNDFSETILTFSKQVNATQDIYITFEYAGTENASVEIDWLLFHKAGEM